LTDQIVLELDVPHLNVAGNVLKQNK
jgi:hypothetical protein